MRIFFATLFLFISLLAHCCSCFGPGNFCDVISHDLLGKGNVIMAVKLNDVAHGMELEIIKEYGNDIEKDRITVWGDLGWLCREYTSGFPIGDTLVLNLYQLGKNTVSDLERMDDYTLSFCGRHYLHVKNGKVVGFINSSDAIQSVDIEIFDSYFETGECEILETEVARFEAIVTPNPFVTDLYVRTSQRNTTLYIYDITGKLVLEQSSGQFYHYIDDSEFDFISGMYILRIVGQRLEDKIIKIVKS